MISNNIIDNGIALYIMILLFIDDEITWLDDINI
jgi:hypothetical protein